jgi:uncharacterized PurR-regulated membrane protein YhhQ (DUF165 family)
MLVDSVVFMTLAFYALGESLGSNIGFLVGMIISYWLVKCNVSVLQTPLVYLGVRWLKSDTQKV